MGERVLVVGLAGPVLINWGGHQGETPSLSSSAAPPTSPQAPLRKYHSLCTLQCFSLAKSHVPRAKWLGPKKYSVYKVTNAR